MKKKKLLLLAMMTAMLSWSNVHVSIASEGVPLEVGYDDPLEGQNNPQRGPIPAPEVSIDDYTLYFGTPCDGYTLSIVNEDGDVEYSTVIPTSTTSIILPSWLSGEYEIRLYPADSNIYFYGWIEL